MVTCFPSFLSLPLAVAKSFPSFRLPEVTVAIEIDGTGVIIDGLSSTQLFSVGVTGALTIKNAALRHGKGNGDGGCISCNGVLTMFEVSVTGCQAASNGGPSTSMNPGSSPQRIASFQATAPMPEVRCFLCSAASSLLQPVVSSQITTQSQIVEVLCIILMPAPLLQPIAPSQPTRP